MTRRVFRVFLFLGLIGAAALAGYQGWRLERARIRQLASAGAFDAITLRLAQSVIDLRASERAYVSSGQGFAFWKPRVDALLQQIRQDLTSLKMFSGAADASVAADAALDALNDAARLEKRIAEAAEAGRVQFAADLVFADGMQASLALERATNAAIAAARGDLAAYQRDARVQELLLAGESACIGLFLALMWFPSRQRPAAVPTERAAAALDLPLRPPPPPIPSPTPSSAPIPTQQRALAAPPEPARVAARVSTAPTAATPAVPLPVASAKKAEPAGSAGEALTAAADLCTSLARVTDANELGGLLAQMSQQLDAAGVIVWLAAPDGSSLRPALSHGYPAEALGRLGRLDLASENATARAFRLRRPQIVAAKDSMPGAIVVPITGGAGCVGAVAAELRHGRERDTATLALARIFAAQLATLTDSHADQAAPADSAASAGATDPVRRGGVGAS